VLLQKSVFDWEKLAYIDVKKTYQFKIGFYGQLSVESVLLYCAGLSVPLMANHSGVQIVS
jgi:hypothetical protein